MHHLVQDIGVAILAATLLGFVAHLLRQPIILGYLVAGAIVGPTLGRGWVADQESIEVIAEIGLILLLFIIGLEMNVKALLASGAQLLVAGFGQFPLCVLLGVGLFTLFGYRLGGGSSGSDGLYLALTCALSSTAVVVKLLYDKSELDTLPGRMTVGTLVIQDIYAIFILAFQPNFSHPSVGPVLKALFWTIALLGIGLLMSKFVLGAMFRAIAKAPEMVVALSIGWCAAVAGAAGWMGLSKEMGGLVAGLSIAAFPYSVHVTAKTLPLRDFFLTLFFVSLGMQITAPRREIVGIVSLLVAFVIASRFLTLYPLLVATGAGRRTAFITSLNLSQISEFSLVIVSLGAATYHHVSENTVAAMIYAMAIMAVLSSYAIRYNHQLFLAFDRLMGRIGRGSTAAPQAPPPIDREHRIVLLGFHRVGWAFIAAVERECPPLLKSIKVIDFNSEVLAELRAKGITADFGDISSHDTLHHAQLHHAQLILCTIPDMLLKGTNNQTLVRLCRVVAPKADVVAVADDARQEELLRAAGATVVVNPHKIFADMLVSLAGVESKNTALSLLAIRPG